MNTDSHLCDRLFAIFLGDLTEEEKQAFERHLIACSDCQEELKQLKQTWDTLPYSMDEQEPPPELKSEVLGAILNGHSNPQPLSSHPIGHHRRRSRTARNYAVASAIAALLLLGSAGIYGVSHWPKTPEVQSDLSLPAQMVKQISLKSFDASSPGARGQAFLMQKGDSLQLVLQASGLPELQGEQAYQVWIVKSGNRLNGGTFRVDPQGNGVLTFKFDVDNREFDTIGITLEPDPLGTKPRGKKVLGT
jgi:hypothetical protein